jgi:hypothetical protein
LNVSVPFNDTDDDIGWLRQSELENENPLPQIAVMVQVPTTLPPQERALPQFRRFRCRRRLHTRPEG